MTDATEPVVPAEQFAKLMRAMFNQPATDTQKKHDPEAEARSALRRQVLDLLAGNPIDPETPGASAAPERDPEPTTPREALAAHFRNALGIPTNQED
jgi:hypothetical protein